MLHNSGVSALCLLALQINCLQVLQEAPCNAGVAVGCGDMLVHLGCRLAYGGYKEALRHEFYKMRYVANLIALQIKLRGCTRKLYVISIL